MYKPKISAAPFELKTPHIMLFCIPCTSFYIYFTRRKGKQN